MKKSNRGFLLILASLVMFSVPAWAQGTAFQYQGRLNDGANPANGSYQLQFRLFDSPAGGAAVGTPISDVPVTATQGVFSVRLDFGAAVFTGANRFLEISVRHNAGEAYTTLSPREQIASSPYSIRTLSAATADLATNAQQLGGVPASQYLQTNGNGSGLTNLNAASITTGTLSNARLGQIPTANIADNAVTSPKIAGGQVVKGVTVGAATLTDNVTIAQGTNIGITTAGNTVTISSTSGGVGGGGTPNRIPFWNTPATLSDSLISQDNGVVRLPSIVTMEPVGTGGQISLAAPNGETGITIAGASGRADLRFNGTSLKLVAGPAGGPPTETNGIMIRTNGNVSMGLSSPPEARLQVVTGQAGEAVGTAIYGLTIRDGGIGIRGGVGGFPINALAGRFDGAVAVNGQLVAESVRISGLGVAGGTFLCASPGNVISYCSSSRRYKKDFQPFTDGMSFIDRLRPFSYKWRSSDAPDIGFAAEDVAEINPLFVTHNHKGEIEGVKYDRLSVVFVNAFKEQQKQIELQQKAIEEQRKQIENLTKIVCEMNSKAEICRENKE